MAEWKRTVLVTGGAGFIASHLVIHLVKKYPNYRVIAFDTLAFSASVHSLNPVKGYPNFKFIQGNIQSVDFVRHVLQTENVDTVLHLAGQAYVDMSFGSSLEFTMTNVYGTHVLINASVDAGVKSFLFASTDQVYGSNGSETHREADKSRPTNPYAASKAAAECIVMSYWDSLKFPVIITRANNVYGPHQYPNTVIPKFISFLLGDKKCCLHGEGQTTRNFIYVTDIAEVFDVLMHNGKPGEVYNIGTDTEVSMAELASTLIKKVKGASEKEEVEKWIEFVPDPRPCNDPGYLLDTSKLQNLGWKPKISWEEGLDKTIAWYSDERNFSFWKKK